MANRTRSILIRFEPDELAALDAYCADLRRMHGDATTRSHVVRTAVADLIDARAPAPLNTPASTAEPTRISETEIIRSRVSDAMALAGVAAKARWEERREIDPDSATEWELVIEIYASMHRASLD
jgi:hypothetical protein